MNLNNEDEADRDAEALMSPMPTAVARSLKDDPNYIKCPRCWHMHTVLLNFDGLCDRCCNELVADWPGHESVPFIRACREAQKRHFSRPAS
jgi:hypothetical protein